MRAELGWKWTTNRCTSKFHVLGAVVSTCSLLSLHAHLKEIYLFFFSWEWGRVEIKMPLNLLSFFNYKYPRFHLLSKWILLNFLFFLAPLFSSLFLSLCSDLLLFYLCFTYLKCTEYLKGASSKKFKDVWNKDKWMHDPCPLPRRAL